MTELTLVRHGQANSAGRDEASYDKLSKLGHRQAAWLGEYLDTVPAYDRIVSGTMRRHLETARGANIAGLPHERDERLNELDYFGLSQSLRDSHGVPFPDTPESFAAHVPQVLGVWREGQMSDRVETYEQFRDRIFAALRSAAAGGDRPLLVTSTGVIATLTAIALGLDTSAKTKMFLAIAHTSIHRFEFRGDDLFLSQFGGTPHLDTAERLPHRTFV
ncbi:Broad specificity phosphatase PhoE [Poseidonocella pacifica]|uniref:Broad specificity phosphatase PhoE n=1 Tax=Poseidonocella pacifica TaxID=871651 RepID=A0A1I0XDV9_9RHOB|nr:histidine phosphatase family protein [Poseidonocella pacifica]SFA99205.1 Broad specificity phosphatase PhoE [Poseidonocella pacifica]